MNDERFISGKLHYQTTNKVSVTDGINFFLIDESDNRYLFGYLKGVNKGKITVEDKCGNTFQTTTDDPRLLTGGNIPCHKRLYTYNKW